MFVSGSGYNDNVTGVCADGRLAGTYLSLHHYGFWNTSQTSYDWWANDLKNRIGSCASRTVLDEWGAPMTTGLDYNGGINGSAFIAYVQADSDTLHALGMGSVYWPGLRTGDTYSMETLGGSGTNLTLSNTNASGVSRLQWAWGAGGGTSIIRGTASNRCLDVVGAATGNGTQVVIWDCNGGRNQQSGPPPRATALVVYGTKCLDVNGASPSPGAKVQIWDCNGGANQQWNVGSNGTVTSVQTGLCLDANGGGTANGTTVDRLDLQRRRQSAVAAFLSGVGKTPWFGLPPWPATGASRSAGPAGASVDRGRKEEMASPNTCQPARDADRNRLCRWPGPICQPEHRRFDWLDSVNVNQAYSRARSKRSANSWSPPLPHLKCWPSLRSRTDTVLPAVTRTDYGALGRAHQSRDVRSSRIVERTAHPLDSQGTKPRAKKRPRERVLLDRRCRERERNPVSSRFSPS